MRDTQRERQRYRQREKQAPCGELDVGPIPDSSCLLYTSDAADDVSWV